MAGVISDVIFFGEREELYPAIFLLKVAYIIAQNLFERHKNNFKFIYHFSTLKWRT